MDELYEHHRRYDAAYELLLELDKKSKPALKPPLKKAKAGKECIARVLAEEAEDRRRCRVNDRGRFSGDWYLQKSQWEGEDLFGEGWGVRQ
jgi:hypothetical protein